ncbi:Crp/Fnr family transcriptional regulator [Sphingobacterium chungjuense]|uniref:Crp/Fnr family transcriptional regulator n=1 Tax=Sphingobacterium chungjuense TaxID=2675553 RepID=UPI00140E2D92|nr:Crp/Fnr family transcriptional regulator [Sphingobacterium chungjuense]
MCTHIIPAWKEVVTANRKVIKLKKGEQFIQEGAPSSGIYFVQEGMIKVYKQWGDKESIVRFAKKGSIVGHRGLSSSQTLFPISASALENSEVCFVPLDFFRTVLKGNPAFTYEMLLFYADELQISEQKTNNQVQLSVKGRLAWCILQLAHDMGLEKDDYIAIRLSKTDIASYIGSTYESIYRMMLELENEKIIETANKRIRILDRTKLTEYSLI